MKTDQKYFSQYVISISDYLFRIIYTIDKMYKNCLKVNTNLKYNLFIPCYKSKHPNRKIDLFVPTKIKVRKLHK